MAKADPATLILFVSVGALAFIAIYLIGTALAHGATIFAVSRLHLGMPVNIGESYKIVRPLVGRIINIVLSVVIRFMGALMLAYLVLIMIVLGGVASLRTLGGGALVFAIMALIGLALFIIGVIWSIRIYCGYALAVPICIVEKLSARDCLARSRLLTKGSLPRVLLIYFLSGIMVVVLNVVLSIPNYVDLALHQGVASLPFQIWGFVSGFLAGTLAGPVATIAIALVYYDERVRKEAFDLQLMMAAIGVASPVQPLAAPPPPAIG
jgi:hypothetical protein